MTAGHSSAIGTALTATQEPPSQPGLPNSCRAAAAVDDSGFHSASTPSTTGMDAGAANTPDRNANGNSKVCTAVTAPGPRTSSPSQMPTQSSAKRSHSSSPTAASTAPTP